MRHRHDTVVYDDSGRKSKLETGYEADIWQCDTCGHPNQHNEHDSWPTCVYCGRFRDDDARVLYGWGYGNDSMGGA